VAQSASYSIGSGFVSRQVKRTGSDVNNSPPSRAVFLNRRAARICHFSFLSIFHEYIFYSGNILRRIIFVNVSKSSDPERLNNICVANVSDQAAYF
jgi:hypothetical protein